MKEALEFLRKIKSVSIATVSEDGPSVRIADVMLVEDEKLYFVTARGKSFYKQLKKIPKIAIVSMDDKYKTVRVSGDIIFVDRSYIDKIFEANPGLNSLYPGNKKDILEVFCMIKGRGEVFDLSVTPPVRQRFSFGEEVEHPCGYTITDKCIACGNCKDACPTKSIKENEIYKVNTSTCLECGRCQEICPVDAILSAKDF